jgi:ABC-type Mn2+/Zn2+ transport system ATPase subunit
MSEPRFPYSSGRHADPVKGAPSLLAEDIVVGYPGAKNPALRGVSLEVPSGTCMALVGPNGSGKSTLLKVVAGLLPVVSGSIRVYGNRVGACHHRVAYLPQRGEIDWAFPISVERLVLTGRYVHLGWLRLPTTRDKDIVAASIRRLGLSSLATQKIGNLSGGQQQRVLLARALAQEADLLLLDEPFNAVDASTQDTIYEAMGNLRRQGKTLIVATHDLSRLTGAFDMAAFLKAGKLVSQPDTSNCFLNLQKEHLWIF